MYIIHISLILIFICPFILEIKGPLTQWQCVRLMFLISSAKGREFDPHTVQYINLF